MSLSEAEIENLSAHVEAISSTQILLARPALKALLELTRCSGDISAADAAKLLRKWVDKVQSPTTIRKVFHPLRIYINLC
jgi:hypothetical protein